MSTAVAASSPTRALAEFAVDARHRDLPDDLPALARRCILDSLGCGVFAATTPWSTAVARVVKGLGQSPDASVWGSTLRADPLGAAMVNGTAAQGYELDDCHDQSMSHYGAAVVPTALALGQSLGNVDGHRLLRSVIVGYELGTRIGNVVSPSVFHRGFHPCGLTGTFAAAATAATLLELDVDKLVSALGLAGSQAAGLMASQFGAMAKRFHSGKAAQNGIIAALSAREGLTGVRDVLEAPYGGFCSTYADDYDLALATDGLGSDFEMRRNGFKRYSSLASSQCAVDALREVRERHSLSGKDVRHVRIETTNVVYRHCGWPYVPAEIITAQMNLPYTAAVTLLEGTAFVDQYADHKLRDPEILDLAGRVEVTVDPELDALGPDEMRATRARVTTVSGEEHTAEVRYRSGHHLNPLSDEALRAKFRDLAGRVITDDAVAAVEKTVDEFEDQPAPANRLGEHVQQVRV